MGGTCNLNDSNVKQMEHGAVMGKDYCAMYLKIKMPVCDSCRYFEKRIEFYSNMATGCGDEFEVPKPEPPPTPKPEPEKPKEKEEETKPELGRYLTMGAGLSAVALTLV